MIRNSIPRLRAIRFKDGRASVRIIRARHETCEAFARSARSIAEYRPDMAGYAIVAWTRDGSTSVDCATVGHPVPTLLMPEIARMAGADYIHNLDAE